MDDGRRWSVLVHADEVTGVTGVLYALREVIGVPPETGLQLARLAQRDGFVPILELDRQDQAEACVARLQLFGLHATAWQQP